MSAWRVMKVSSSDWISRTRNEHWVWDQSGVVEIVTDGLVYTVRNES